MIHNFLLTLTWYWYVTSAPYLVAALTIRFSTCMEETCLVCPLLWTSTPHTLLQNGYKVCWCYRSSMQWENWSGATMLFARHGKRLSSEMLREQNINLFPFARSAVGSPVEGKYLSSDGALHHRSFLIVPPLWMSRSPSLVFLEKKKHPALLTRIMNLHISLCISFHHFNVSMRLQR